MNINNDLEQKLNMSNNYIDNILGDSVNVKIISKINDLYMFDKDTMSLPSITLTKGLLKNNLILDLIAKELNIPIINIEMLPFSYYNNYDVRYYIIEIDIKQLENLNSKYIYSELINITDKEEYSVLSKEIFNNK